MIKENEFLRSVSENILIGRLNSNQVNNNNYSNIENTLFKKHCHKRQETKYNVHNSSNSDINNCNTSSLNTSKSDSLVKVNLLLIILFI